MLDLRPSMSRSNAQDPSPIFLVMSLSIPSFLFVHILGNLSIPF